jgi:hypothetical protein
MIAWLEIPIDISDAIPHYPVMITVVITTKFHDTSPLMAERVATRLSTLPWTTTFDVTRA